MYLVTLAILLFIGQTVATVEDKDTTASPISTPLSVSTKNPSTSPLPTSSPSAPSSSLLTSSTDNTLTTSFTTHTSLSTHSDAMTDSVQSTALLPSTNTVVTSELLSTDSLHDLTSLATPASTATAVFTPPPLASTSSVVPTPPTVSTAPESSTAGINPSSSSAFITTASASPAPTAPTPSGQSTSFTKPTTVPSTTKVTSPATSPATSPVPQKPIKISETNILLNDDVFLEVQGPDNAQAHNLSLAVQDASQPYVIENATIVPLEGTFNGEGYLLAKNLSNALKQSSFKMWKSVLVVLLDSRNNSNLDGLVYSTAVGKVNGGNSERFSIKYNLIVDPLYFAKVNITFSRCPLSGSSEEFVLTKQSKNRKNICDLTFVKYLELKMTSRVAVCKLSGNFNNTLARAIISGVNGKKSCGFSWGMITKFQSNFDCSGDKEMEVKVSFTVASALQEQKDCVLEGYKSLLSDKFLELNDTYTWTMANCTEKCFPSIKPPKNDEDDKIRVTVAVVVSCIGVFLIVLIAVVIYMKSKRNRILQFRMSRLDDDEDDLIGDLDDFLGNQAPTFHR